MKQIRRHVTYANVMSSLAVFLILGGATAFAAVKKVGPNQIKANSIKTGKIVKEAVAAGKIKNGAVIEAKIGDGAVTTNKLADNAVTTPKIATDAVTTDKIANDAVTGDKVNESTLGEVPNAKAVGGVTANALTIGRSGSDASCFGTTNYTCGTATLTLPRAGRVLLISQLPMHPDADNSSASCHINRNGVEVPETTTTPGALQNASGDEGSEIANGGVTTVTGVIPAGVSAFTQVCSDTGGEPHFIRTSISAVLLGTE